MEQAQRRGWIARNWKWALPVGIIGLVFCFAIGIVTLVMTIIKSTGAYQDAVTKAQKNPAAVQALGDPIEPGLLVTGSVKNGRATLSIPVSGSRQGGTLYVSAVQSNGGWSFSKLDLAADGQAQPINLLAP